MIAQQQVRTELRTRQENEQKAKQSTLINSWKPWEHSTEARTPEGRAIFSKNALVGNANRAAALAHARQELKAAEEKILKLSRGRENPYEERILRELM